MHQGIAGIGGQDVNTEGRIQMKTMCPFLPSSHFDVVLFWSVT